MLVLGMIFFENTTKALETCALYTDSNLIEKYPFCEKVCARADGNNTDL